jgi:hypothetical protein
VRDHAAVVTTAVLQITSASSLPQGELRFQLESLLRDEFDAVARQALADVTAYPSCW